MSDRSRNRGAPFSARYSLLDSALTASPKPPNWGAAALCLIAAVACLMVWAAAIASVLP
jgi:hypothetical protein